MKKIISFLIFTFILFSCQGQEDLTIYVGYDTTEVQQMLHKKDLIIDSLIQVLSQEPDSIYFFKNDLFCKISEIENGIHFEFQDQEIDRRFHFYYQDDQRSVILADSLKATGKFNLDWKE